ncbi:S-adenosyl-L-methionine-dependent methyltransferase [Myriangium duriaei CBS 260.36]|uniref:S-adenosyl-L-methionine-dependent methyltransferase n=1 Tax=Myriangium duriaei CBS 260.36 TaxID=1168546 RepID=A0A9P4MGN7_9PEZI|nr:S-adenosyl-L-methionine-dependent methyltransferase [Myriangium duriaei CBS 260.36]
MSTVVHGFAEHEPNRSNSAFNLNFSTDKPALEWFNEHPIQEKLFGDLMESWFSHPAFNVNHVVLGYDWNALGVAHLVDVGGAAGRVSRAIAEVAPQLRFTVQDQPGPIQRGEDEIPSELRHRFSFQVHDFFEPNTQNADVFLLSHVLHDWPDAEARKILSGVAHRMTGSTRMIIVDSVSQTKSQNVLEASPVRDLDIFMMTTFNGKERDERSWRRLFDSVGLSISNITTPPGSAVSLIEVLKKH